MLSFPKLALAAAAAVLLAATLSGTPASAAALPGALAAKAKPESLVTKAQFGLSFGFGGPSYYSQPYYYPQPYYSYSAPFYTGGPQAYYSGYAYRPYYAYRSYRPYYAYRAYRPYYRSYAYRPYRPAYYRSPVRRWDSRAVEECAERFRSFDDRSGTYVTYGGDVVLCPYLR